MLAGDKVNLRLITEKDLSQLYSLVSNLSNRGQYFPQTLVSEVEFTKKFYDNGFWTEDFGRLLIVDKLDRIVGSIYYFKTAIYSDALEIGYILFDELSRGKGYTTEALKLLTAYLFSTKTIGRVQLRISLNHEASKKVALKAGFQFDGVREAVMFLNGEHVDLEEYVILRKNL